MGHPPDSASPLKVYLPFSSTPFGDSLPKINCGKVLPTHNTIMRGMNRLDETSGALHDERGTERPAG